MTAVPGALPTAATPPEPSPPTRASHENAGLGPVHNPVLLSIALVGVAAAFGLAFLSQAPNRLVTGVGLPLRELLGAQGAGISAWIGLPAALLVIAGVLPARKLNHALVWMASGVLLAGLVWLAGAHAKALSDANEGSGRTSLGGSFWVLSVLAWLAASDAVQRLRWGVVQRTLALGAVLLPVVVLAASGALDALSLFKEYDNRQEVFDAALWRHVQIVISTLIPAVLIGVPLGIAAYRRPATSGPLFVVLNVIQTVPSIALFGLLMAPLVALSHLLPGWGISGIGLVPAVIALTLYSLLPIVQSTVTGLRDVPRAVIESATGMGLTKQQVFWKVEVPLALPLLWSGLRLTTVQTVGLAVVAALVGAGGLGAIMFQGLLSSALDLVLLGVLPVVALAVAVDAVFGLLGPFFVRQP